MPSPFKLSIPIFFAYFPLGIVFSVLFVHLGFAWYLATPMSLLVYGGSVQYVAIYMMHTHAGYFSIFIATIFLALRNTFYSIHLIHRFKTSWWKKCWLFFSLVDATYAIMISHENNDPKQDLRFCTKLSLYIYAYWVGGTLVGALFANLIPNIPDPEFILTCFFLLLALDHFLKYCRAKPFIVATIAAIVAALVVPHQFVFAAICLSIVGLFIWQSKHTPGENCDA